MARNEYAGTCFRCGLRVAPGTGHFRRDRGGWLVHHANVPGHGRVTCAQAKAQRERLDNELNTMRKEPTP